MEQPGREPGDRHGRDRAGDGDERLDGRRVPQRLQARTVQENPHDRGREHVEREIQEVEADHQHERDSPDGGEEIGVRRDTDPPQLAHGRVERNRRQHQGDEHEDGEDLEQVDEVHDFAFQAVEATKAGPGAYTLQEACTAPSVLADFRRGTGAGLDPARCAADAMR